MRVERAGTAPARSGERTGFEGALARARAPEPRRAGAPQPPPGSAGAAGVRGVDAPPGAWREPPRASDDVAPVPALAALARALPPAIAGAARGGPLALSFGRSLDVELRATPAGVEVVLRPEGGLVRAALLELPRILAALAARGVRVARAEVRGRPSGGGRAR